jgi:hypothetical protein
MMETGTIMLYHAEKYGRFLPKGGEKWPAIEWLMWQMGGVGPMLGQVHHFVKFNRGKSHYAEERYSTEAKRLYGVLNRRLEGKERLGRMTKAGQADIRRLPIIGAMSRLGWLGQRTIPEGSWRARMLACKPRILVAIALANKMARQIWAMLTKDEDYRDLAALAGAT